jgi:acetate kinase
VKTASPCVLTINGGSSSIRFALYRTGDPLKRGLDGKVDRIGLPGTMPRVARLLPIPRHFQPDSFN